MDTVIRKRIEILTDGPLVPRIAAACEAVGINGHTVIPVLSGRGRAGNWSEDRLSGAQSKVIVLAIASTVRADALLDVLAPLLESHGLLVTVGDVAVIRGERFG